MIQPGMLSGSSDMTSFKSSSANAGSFPINISLDLNKDRESYKKYFDLLHFMIHLKSKHLGIPLGLNEGDCSILSLIRAPRPASIAFIPASNLFCFP